MTATKAEVAKLTEDLDSLLQEALQLLDKYQTSRSELNASMEQAHLSLARANFSNPNRFRYGQDFFDERMQASARTTERTAGSGTDSAESEIEMSYETQSASGLSPMDPLKWFGILVPSSLRRSQSEFREALSHAVSLVNTSQKLDQIQIEVCRVRKELRKLDAQAL